MAGLVVFLALATQAEAATTLWVTSPPQFSGGFDGALSANGRFIAFSASGQIYVKDLRTGTRRVVSVNSRGRRGNEASFNAEISPDGRFVVFCSWASNLVRGDRLEYDSSWPPPDRYLDVFVHDRRTRTTIRASIGRNGRQPNDGSCARSFVDLAPAISASGRFVAFASHASNLVRGDTNGARDIFVRDTKRDRTHRVSISSSERQANNHSDGAAISADGRFVSFTSLASNLVPRDRNGSFDVFVRDRWSGRTTRASVTSSGEEREGHAYGPTSISATGRFVVFESYAPLTGSPRFESNIYLKDRRSGAITLASRGLDGDGGHGGSYDPDVSADGRYVAWWSGATDLVAGDEICCGTDDDIFLFDRVTDETTIVSLRDDGTNAWGFALHPSVSGDGRFVAWSSDAPYTPDDTNGTWDVYRRGPLR